MKVYTTLVIDIASGAIEHEESHEYDGPIAECKGGGSTTTVQQSDPWSGVQPYLGELYGGAQRAYQQGPQQYYPGSTVADPSAYTQQSIEQQAQRAQYGSPVTQAAQQNATNTLGGQYLYNQPGMRAGMVTNQSALQGPARQALEQTAGGNYLGGSPYLDQQIQRAQNQIQNRLDSQFNSAGRYGGGLHKIGLGEAFSDSANSLIGQNYMQERANQLSAANQLGGFGQGDISNRLAGLGLMQGAYGQERNNQLQAMGLSPMLAAQDYADIGQLAQAGSRADELSQARLNDQIARWDFAQNAPWQQLQNYAGIINPGIGAGGTQMSSQPYHRNTAAGVLGGAAAGAAIFPGWGAIPGAILGAMY